jgi:hypothetical protein
MASVRQIALGPRALSRERNARRFHRRSQGPAKRQFTDGNMQTARARDPSTDVPEIELPVRIKTQRAHLWHGRVGLCYAGQDALFV